MLIRHFMTRDVTTVSVALTCGEAWDLFQAQGLRRAPLVEGAEVVGMVTDRDLLRVLPLTLGALGEGETGADARATPLTALRRRALLWVRPSDHLERAAGLMLEHRVGGLPVLEAGALRGIVTESDLFRVFVALKERSHCSRLTLHWPGSEGEPPDPARLALATGVEIREHLRYDSPGEGLLLGLRVRGSGAEDFLERMLASGFLLIDREDYPPAPAARP